jgi:hypothetical protein
MHLEYFVATQHEQLERMPVAPLIGVPVCGRSQGAEAAVHIDRIRALAGQSREQGG